MGKFTEYKLPLRSMPEGFRDVEYRLGKTFFINMENNDVRGADILVKLSVEHKNDYYDLRFDISGTITVACDRCLDDLELPVETTYHIVVKYGEDYRDDSDDYLEIPYSDADLNVAYMIHDTIALTIPFKHVHPMGKCNRAMTTLLKRHHAGPSADSEDTELEDNLMDEIDNIDAEESAQGGGERATDPRWDKLRDLNHED